jgi:hypothetical protein
MSVPCTYLCQGCYHLIHQECDRECRYCLSPCLCHCHVNIEPSPEPEQPEGVLVSLDAVRKRKKETT